MKPIDIAIIGGTGVYQMEDLDDVEEIEISTPFGRPSDAIVVGTLLGERIAFLPRHGRGHVIIPSEIPNRANIYALKSLGVRYIVGISACGSLREDFGPGHIVIPDQLVDFTKGKREYTFFGNGLVAHIGTPEPFSPELSSALYRAVNETGGEVHRGGAFITIEGPRFSTRAESNLYRQWGMSIIGMTTSPEAFLAMEAEIAYATMAHVTDFDVWHVSEEAVTVEMVVKNQAANSERAQNAIRYLVRDKNIWQGDFAAHSALETAMTLVSDWESLPAETLRSLEHIIAKYRPQIQ